MKTYCVRQKNKTECVPGSERIAIANNGRQMLVCTCAECGATKTQFTRGQTGGAVSKNDVACGYNLRGKRPGTLEECFNTGQVRQWGVNKVDKAMIDRLLSGKKALKKPTKKSLIMPNLSDFNMRPDLDEKYEELVKNWNKMTKPKKIPIKNRFKSQDDMLYEKPPKPVVSRPRLGSLDESEIMQMFPGRKATKKSETKAAEKKPAKKKAVKWYNDRRMMLPVDAYQVFGTPELDAKYKILTENIEKTIKKSKKKSANKKSKEKKNA